MTFPDDAYQSARTLVVSRLGLDFPENRKVDLTHGLLRACRLSSSTAIGPYLDLLAALPDDHAEWQVVARILRVGETYFFRGRSCFDALEQQVLPGLIESRRTEGRRCIRLWSAGCATGEEPYSLAILLDRLLPDREEWSISLLATDLDRHTLEKAEQATYREWAFRETPQWIRDQYFRRHEDGSFVLDPSIRKMVSFMPLNLAADTAALKRPYPEKVDLILCRNVLMYFSPDVQRAAISRLRNVLAPEGWLVVSPAESCAEQFRPLVAVNFPDAILFRNSQAASPPAGAMSYRAVPLPFPCDPPRPILSIPVPSTESPPPELAPRPVASAPDEEGVILTARSMADQGRLEEAQRLCETWLADHQFDAEAYLLLAAVHQERGKSDAAIAAVRRALYLVPDSAPANFTLGRLLAGRGDAREARRCMERVVRSLKTRPPEQMVLEREGLTAGRLLETAGRYLNGTMRRARRGRV